MAQEQSFVQGYLSGMPGWMRALVAALTIVPVALAISGMILNVNVGSYLDAYMEIQLEAQRANSVNMTQQIIDAIDGRIGHLETQLTALSDRLAVTEATATAVLEENTEATTQLTYRVERIENWACIHADAQRLTDDRPEFCLTTTKGLSWKMKNSSSVPILTAPWLQR